MISIDVVPLPRLLTDELINDRVVVVFDVLRATTTIAAAMHAGAHEVRVFDSIDAARIAAGDFTGPKVLCGEVRCLPPAGFDLGNSPGDYTAARVGGKTIFLSTTNGTRALVVARRAPVLITAAVVNAQAVAAAVIAAGRDVTLLCAGTDGEESPEDLIGAGFVIRELGDHPVNLTRRARAALELATRSAAGLQPAFEQTAGGRNIVKAGLGNDIAFAARPNVFNVVPRSDGETLTIRLILR